MSEPANERSRTATRSRRLARADDVEMAPNKLHRPRPGTQAAAHASRPKASVDRKADPEPVVATPRGSTDNGIAPPTAARGPRALGSPQSNDRPIVTSTTAASGRPPAVTTRTRPSAARTTHSSTRPTTSSAKATSSTKQPTARRTSASAAVSARPTKTSNARSPTHPPPLATPTNTVKTKSAQNHVISADDPVFARRHDQRRASSTGCAMSFPALKMGNQPFELLAADEPVPAIPEDLEKELLRQYTENLLHLPLSDVECVVRAMCHDTDFKLVMTYMKGEQLRLKTEAKRERSHSAPTGSGAAGGAPSARAGMSGSVTLGAPPVKSAKAGATTKTTARKRGKSAPTGAAASASVADKPGWVKTPKVGETTAEASQRARSGRITAKPAGTSLATSRRRGMTPAAQEAAVNRFRAAFSKEVRYVFLDEACHLCNARRLRFYREQPAIVRERNIVIPDDVLRLVYAQVVNKLLYRTFGWSEQECKPYTPAVVDILILQMSEPHDDEPSGLDAE